ncbi:MAG: hypothetical protein JWN44_3266 [Myxococcales bacterium]|nr:hypothetical protein [Myxococcales bacterium]
MKAVLSTPQLAVFDDVLPTEELALLWRYVRSEDYVFVNRGRWEKVYGLLDGRILEGRGVASHPRGDLDGVASYPTGRAIDLIVRLLIDHADRFAPWIGRFAESWDCLTARPFLYPQGSALSWHDDGEGRVGAFSFYAHPYWNSQWGGELCVAEESTRHLHYPAEEVMGRGRVPVGMEIDNSYESAQLLEAGVGTYIMPKPNRLVVQAAGYLHRVTRVDASAGAAVRASISGFFMRRQAPGAAA